MSSRNRAGASSPLAMPTWVARVAPRRGGVGGVAVLDERHDRPVDLEQRRGRIGRGLGDRTPRERAHPRERQCDIA